MILGRDEQDFQFRFLLKALCQGTGDAVRCQKLIFNIDELLGCPDHVDVERLNLANFRLIAYCGNRSRNGDFRIAEVGLERIWPRVAALFGRHRGNRMTSRSVPARADQFAKLCRAVAIDAHLKIVKRRITFPARVASPLIVGFVSGCIPAPDCQIDSAAKCDRVINDDDFLMMRSAKRQDIIQADLDLTGGFPVKIERGDRLPLQRIDDRIIPQQKIYGQLGALFDKRCQKRPQLQWQPVIGLIFLSA